MDKRPEQRPPYFTEEQWQAHLRRTGQAPPAGDEPQPRKPKAKRGNGAATAEAPSAAGKPSSALARFEMRPEGLYRRDVKTDSWKWVAQPFEFFGRCREPRDAQGVSRGWGRSIRFNDHDGVTCDVIVSDADLHRDVGVLAGELAEQGFTIANNPAARNAFAEFISRDANADRITLAARTGWLTIGGKRVFVLPDRIIGLDASMERVKLRASVLAPYAMCGSLADWRDGVGELAHGNKLAILAISTAFASSLLQLGGYEGGGVHIWGASSLGKTTLARLNASVWGKPTEGGWLRPWRSTSNAIEAMLAGACDAGLPFDEIAQADAGTFGEVIYMITGGQGKARLRRDASLRDAMTWRVLIFSTGEFPVEVKISESAAARFGGGKHRGGQSVRLIDIKADREFGAFDDLKGQSGADYVAGAYQSAMTYYGTAGPAFIVALIDNEVTGDEVRRMVAAFVTKELHGTDKAGAPKWGEVSGQVERVAERFGLIAAAGELATRFNIVPWARSEATAAAAEIFQQWLGARGGANPHEERQAVEQVRLFIERYGDSRFDDLDAPPRTLFTVSGKEVEIERRQALDRAGYRKGEGDDRQWFVLPEAFRKTLCAGLDANFVARLLNKLGMLEAGDGRNLTKQMMIHGAQLRFYVLTEKILEHES